MINIETRGVLRGILFVLLIWPTFAHAQVLQTQRFEIKQKNSDDYFTIISLEEEGLALIREKDKYHGNRKLWEVIILDTDLKETNTLNLEINQRYSLLGYEVDKNLLYLLFRTGETTRNSLELIEVN